MKNYKIKEVVIYCPNVVGNSVPTTILEGIGSGSSTGSEVT